MVADKRRGAGGLACGCRKPAQFSIFDSPWVAAARLTGLDCAVAYYGGGIANMIGEKPQCPVMFHWGETDHAIPVEAAKRVAAAHPAALSYIYRAGHGFNCDQRGSYDAESARLARTRSLEFLRQHIG